MADTELPKEINSPDWTKIDLQAAFEIAAELSDVSYLTSADEVKMALSPLMDGDVQFRSFDTTSTELIIVSNPELIAIAFRGTESELDIINDGWFELLSLGFGHLHRGFLTIAQTHLQSMVGTIAAERLKHPKAKILLTGHSLGGALAVVFAALLFEKHTHIKPDLIVTFGQPRCGNSAFAKWFTAAKLPYWRLVNENDLVPDMPPAFEKSDWSHAGEIILFQCDESPEVKTVWHKLGSLVGPFVKMAISFIRKWRGKPNSAAQDLVAFKIAVQGTNHAMALYKLRVKSRGRTGI